LFVWLLCYAALSLQSIPCAGIASPFVPSLVPSALGKNGSSKAQPNAKFVSLCVSKAQTSQRSLFLHPLPSSVILFTLHGALLPLSIACPSLSQSLPQTTHTRTLFLCRFSLPFACLRLRLTLLLALRRCRTSTTSTRVAASLICPLSGRSQPQQQHPTNLHRYTHTHTAGRTRRVGRPPRPASVSLSVTPSRPVIQCDDATPTIRTVHDDATSCTLALAAAAAHRSHLGAVQPRARRHRCSAL